MLFKKEQRHTIETYFTKKGGVALKKRPGESAHAPHDQPRPRMQLRSPELRMAARAWTGPWSGAPGPELPSVDWSFLDAVFLITCRRGCASLVGGAIGR